MSHRLPSPRNFHLRLSQETTLDNHDLKPVPPSKRTWRAIDWISYWISDQFAPAAWQLGASMAATGVTARAAIPAVFFGLLCVGVVMWAAGVIGAPYHVAFPVINRAPWGIYGSLFPVALHPHRDRRQPYRAAPDFSITSIRQYVQLLTRKCKHHFEGFFFRFKAIVCPPAFVAIGIWALVKTKEGGELVRGPVTAGAWPIIVALNAAITIYCTVAVNISVFTRFSKTSKDTWQQVLLLPITGTIPCACGFFAADATLTFRAWTSFGALIFLIATIGVNISANAISFATDAMSVWPAYIDIRRGCALAAVLAVAITRWNLLHSAQGFLNFLGAYGCWLGPISGICLVDYYFLRRQRLDVRQLYTHPGGMYSYSKWGVNPRAYLAFMVAFLPNLPGFINAINPKVHLDVPIYKFNWLFGISVGALVYGVLCKYIWLLPKESLVQEAVYPDEAYFWNHEEEMASTEKSAADAEKVEGGGSESPSSGSFEGMEVDIVFAKTDKKQ
ncbi:related to Uracil permease [Ustilago trichophora]|uniref:Related to Uracil permease n=1 Tax=Ustilago trichophora TaxID=86804 RepID=A0A5C3EJ59_9BASI|nr:related to Uracil permease [Ustilago trichophora]